MASVWKTVRVFISSTFRDMHAERDHLVKVVFPRVRQWCEERRLHLVDIDLRWGVTKDQADNGAAIDICLKEIDGSRPFFVCLLGGRYGWVPNELPPEEMYRFHHLQAQTHLSITHLEILHAALSCIPQLDGTTKQPCAQTFFYFRDPQCLPDPDSLSNWSHEERQQYADAFFERTPTDASAPDRRQMLSELKTTIRSAYEQQERVFDYSGRWNPDAVNPEDDRLRGRLHELEQLGERIEADLKRGIQQGFAEHLATLAADPDPLDVERSLHEAFIENRTQVYVPRTDIEQQLTDYIDGDDSRPLILSGPPGSGKSAILAHWVKGIAELGSWNAESDPGTTEDSDSALSTSLPPFVIARFIGASPASTNLAQLLGNVSRELVRHFELTEDARTKRPIEVPTDPAKILNLWPRILEAAGAKGQVVVVLDAVNQLDRSADPLGAYWLPHKLPTGVRIITSLLEHGEASQPDHELDEGSTADWLATLRRRELPEIPVPPLTDDGRRRIIRELPSVFCKTLADDQVAQLLENEATRNPLFLTVALEELRIFGSFEQISRAITQLPRLDDSQIGGDVENAVEALFGRVLDRLDRETRRQTPDLVPTLFRMLASAREGLSEQEIDDVLARQLPGLAEGDRKSGMQVVLRQVRGYLMRKTAARGTLIDFYHRSFWKAVRATYMPDEASSRQSHHDLADYFAQQPSHLQQSDPADPKSTLRTPHERKVVELPWQRLAAEDWDGLEAVLTDLPFLEAKVEAGMTFELASDYSTAVAALPADRAHRENLHLLGKAIRRDGLFLGRRPQTLFQCLWNTCWWYDCPQAEVHYEPYENPPWRRAGPKLFELLQRWRQQKEQAEPGFVWLRSARPPRGPLDSPLLLTLTGHTRWVTSVSFSPDGRRIVSCSLPMDDLVRVWDAESGQELLQLKANSVEAVSFSLDGRRIAGRTSNSIIIWDGESGQELLTLTKDKDSVDSHCFSPDGRRIVTSFHRYLGYGRRSDTNIRVWDTETGKQVFTTSGHKANVQAVSFSPDGRRILSASYESIRVWDAETGQELSSLEAKSEGNYCFSPDGRRIASWDAYESRTAIRVWDAETGVTLFKASEHEGQVQSVSFSADGRRIVSASRDWTARVWDAETGSPQAVLQGHGSVVDSASFSPDGRRIVTGSWDMTVRVWDAESCPETAVLRIHKDIVTCVCFSPDGRRIASGSADRTVRVWDTKTGQELSVLRGHDFQVRNVSFSPDGRRIVSGAFDGGFDHQQVRVWDAETYECLDTTVVEGIAPVERTACAPAKLPLKALSRDQEFIVEEVASGDPVAYFPLPLECITTHTSGRTWAGADADGVCIITLEDGSEPEPSENGPVADKKESGSLSTEEKPTANQWWKFW